jgi:hypothetical protein
VDDLHLRKKRKLLFLREYLKESLIFTLYTFLYIIITVGIICTTYFINPSYMDYVGLIMTYFAIILFTFYLNNVSVKKQDKKLLNYWLDTLGGSNELIETLIGKEEDKKDIIKNLEIVYSKVLVYSEHDIRKLRLLKGYFKSINNESPSDMFFKLFATFLFGVVATNLSNGNINNLIMAILPHNFHVTDGFLKISNTTMFSIVFLIFILNIIRDMFTHKKRTKVIEEIIDVCIKELESKK